jgi:hypothetical protein
MSEVDRKIKWQTKLETYFAETGEQALCYAWMHRKAEALYGTRTGWIDLPVIILGTLNGAVSVGSDTLFGTAQYASVGVGVVALLTAILTTIGSYFAWAKRAEGHRISAISYDKLHKFLSVEMSLPRNERMEADDLLKYVKTETDRLAEISPLVPPKIIELFKMRFSCEKYAEISKPSITNGLHAIEVYKPSDATPGLRSQDSEAFRPTVDSGVIVHVEDKKD